jgi:hypothetical protein
MKQAAHSLLLLALLAFAGCGRHRAPAGPERQGAVAVEPVPSLAAAIAGIQDGTVRCGGADCPANVGLLLAADAAGGLDPQSDAILGCTASLVGEDLAITNSHCIPSAVKLLPDLCKERVRLTLPASGGGPEETFACAALLGVSARETATSPDLALFRLDRKTKRAPFVTARDGVAPGSTLRSLRVTPDLKHRTGTLVAEDCRAVAGSYRMPVYTDEKSAVVVAGDCKALPGNSGSPLVGEDGRLRAVLQADLPVSDAARAAWGPHADGDLAPLAMGTSLRCLAKDLPEWSWNVDCVTIEEADVAAARPRLRQLLETDAYRGEIDAFLAPYRAQTSLVELARREVSTSALDRREKLEPSCARGAGDISVRIPQYAISVRFNRYLQLVSPRLTLESEPLVELSTAAVPACP